MVYLVVLLVIAVLAVFVALQNPVMVSATFMIWKFEGPLAAVILISFAVGAIACMIALLPAIFKVKQKEKLPETKPEK